MRLRIAVILAHPEESGNVGAVCRAMANCDVPILRIVGARGNYDNETVRRRAIHAADIWEYAEFFDTITDAVRDCMVSFGTTRRRGKNRKGKLLLPEDFAEFIAQKAASGTPTDQESAPGLIALVFGPERAGLTNEELAECTAGLTIPASEGFPSYNLSHAVQILCYIAFRAGICGGANADDMPRGASLSPGYTPITLGRVEKTVAVITDKLADIGFFSVAGRSDMERFWRDILSRAALTEGEAVYIEKIFAKAAGLASRGKKDVASRAATM
ncbi:MAG: RNA methyltransferase [Treponemataceae bacterium]|nr:MAG: RNA methyltransferase [Treponemataceae bacterium]